MTPKIKLALSGRRSGHMVNEDGVMRASGDVPVF